MACQEVSKTSRCCMRHQENRSSARTRIRVRKCTIVPPQRLYQRGTKSHSVICLSAYVHRSMCLASQIVHEHDFLAIDQGSQGWVVGEPCFGHRCKLKYHPFFPHRCLMELFRGIGYLNSWKPPSFERPLGRRSETSRSTASIE